MKYRLPVLGYKELPGFMSEEQINIHHKKHHKAYIDNTNKLLKTKYDSGELGFNLNGVLLHNCFWESLLPRGTTIKGEIKKAIQNQFGSFNKFKKQFSETALSIQGSGWAALMHCKRDNKLLICQIEKHNNNIYTGFTPILVLDMWEHAFYIDYKNNKKDYVEDFWIHVNWEKVNQRFNDK